MTIQEPTEEAIAAAAAILCTGGLVGMPTETVYGLAADAGNGRAVAAIFAAKTRPHFNPLIVHVADMQAAARLGEFTPAAERLARLQPRPTDAPPLPKVERTSATAP